MLLLLLFFFFFKHKTAYEMRISDWSSDVCSSDLMADLNEREKHILAERRLAEDPKTLEELSQVYGVSRERVRQIEVRAFEKLQRAMMRLAGDKKLLPAM